MTEETFPFVEPDYASHPGALLAEELEARGLSQRELARRIGRPFQVVNEIARERKAITADDGRTTRGRTGHPGVSLARHAGAARPCGRPAEAGGATQSRPDDATPGAGVASRGGRGVREKSGAGGGIRTLGLLFTKQLLYH